MCFYCSNKKGRKYKNKKMNQAELIALAQALSTVSEDQFESSLATFITNLQAYFAGQQPPTCPTVVSSVTTFSDGSTQSLPVLPPVPGV